MRDETEGGAGEAGGWERASPSSLPASTSPTAGEPDSGAVGTSPAPAANPTAAAAPFCSAKPAGAAAPISVASDLVATSAAERAASREQRRANSRFRSCSSCAYVTQGDQNGTWRRRGPASLRLKTRPLLRDGRVQRAHVRRRGGRRHGGGYRGRLGRCSRRGCRIRILRGCRICVSRLGHRGRAARRLLPKRRRGALRGVGCLCVRAAVRGVDWLQRRTGRAARGTPLGRKAPPGRDPRVRRRSRRRLCPCQLLEGRANTFEPSGGGGKGRAIPLSRLLRPRSCRRGTKRFDNHADARRLQPTQLARPCRRRSRYDARRDRRDPLGSARLVQSAAPQLSGTSIGVVGPGSARTSTVAAAAAPAVGWSKRPTSSSRRDSSAWGGVVARRLGRLRCASARLGNCRRRRGAPGKRGAHLGL